MKAIIWLFRLALLGNFGKSLAQSDMAPVVDLGYAKYRGQSFDESGVSQWLGIRYAAPPLGNLRYAAPEDPLEEDDTVDAFQHGPLCLATGDDPFNPNSSEDCLFLDVYAPSDANESSKYPVFVFIQGGGFEVNSDPNLNGTGLINASGNKMVIVNFNYRVGSFGFLAGNVMATRASQNNGLKDHRKVFEWVQKHISKFGGDPAHVVIGGDSAGGGAIALHLTAYRGKDEGFFVGAAAESQSFPSMLDTQEANFIYNSLVMRTGCVNSNDSLTCLRSLNASFIQSVDMNTVLPGAQNPTLFMYAPTIDYDLVPDYTVRLFEQGQFIRVPTIWGDATNEGTIFTPESTGSYAKSTVFLQNNYPTLTPEIGYKLIQLYPQNATPQFPDSGSYWRQVSDVYGEIRYICPGIHIPDMYTRYGYENVWNYHYDVQDLMDMHKGYGVPHVAEINSIWGPDNVFNKTPPQSYYGINAPIIPVMQGYWTSFITALNPSSLRHCTSPPWTRWTDSQSTANRIYIQTNNTHMEKVPPDQRHRCQYWTSIALELKQ